MKIEDVKRILDSAFMVRPKEIGCDDCWETMDEYISYMLGEKPMDESFELVETHLILCSLCNEEFQSLLKATRHHKNNLGST